MTSLIGADLSSNNQENYKIYELNSFENLEKYFPKEFSKTWFLFDIDHTVIEFRKLLFRKGVNKLIKYISENYEKYKDLNEQRKLMSWILVKAEYDLKETNLKRIFDDLGKLGACCLGLCHSRTGKFEICECMEKRKIEILKSKDIDINFKVFEKLNKYRFSEICPKAEELEEEYPIYFEGVLFTGKGGGAASATKNSITKGELFERFLEKLEEKKEIEEYPDNVIVIDDKEKFIPSVLEKCEKLGIFCIGLHYTYSEKEKGYSEKEIEENEYSEKEKKEIKSLIEEFEKNYPNS